MQQFTAAFSHKISSNLYHGRSSQETPKQQQYSQWATCSDEPFTSFFGWRTYEWASYTRPHYVRKLEVFKDFSDEVLLQVYSGLAASMQLREAEYLWLEA